MSRCAFHVRCKACDKRRGLPSHPESYYKWNRKLKAHVNRAPACEGCGENEYYISHWMQSRDTKTDKCNCNGYVHLTKRLWPHRIGSKYCWYRKDHTQRVDGDEDYRDSAHEEYLDYLSKEQHHYA